MTDAVLPLEGLADHPPPDTEIIHRHTVAVRLTHWINVVCLTLLLLSGLQIFNAHPELYWGQKGDSFDPAFVSIGVDDRRKIHPKGLVRIGPLTIVTTGVLGVSGGERRAYPRWLTLPASRNLAVGRRWHFLVAWIFVTNGLIYLLSSTINGHLRRDLVPTRGQIRPQNILRDVLDHIRLKHPVGEEARHYNVLQKLAYLGVLLLLILMVLTGLTMSPGVDAALPLLLDVFGGRQSARTIHWLCANLIVLFVIVHVIEVLIAGPVNELTSMITGRYRIRTGAGR